MGKKFFISEQERKTILSMHGLLKESEGEDKIEISRQNYFATGYHSDLNPKIKQDIISQLESAKQFLKEKESQGEVVFIQITSSESAVPNHDNEVAEKPEKPTGWLRERRAETMKKFIESELEKWVGSEINSMPPFLPFKYSEPTQTYDAKINKASDPKYKQDIWVKLEMEVKPAAACLKGLSIEVMYNDTIDPNFPCRGNHTCDYAKFDVKLNGVVVGVANLNNLSTGGGNRTSGPLVISPEMAQQIAKNSANQTLTVSLKCLSTTCHSATPEIRIMREGQIVIHTCTSLKVRNDASEVVVLTLDLCGNIISSQNQQPNAGKVDPASKLAAQQPKTEPAKPLPLVTIFKPGVTSISKSDYDAFSNLARYDANSGLGVWTAKSRNVMGTQGTGPNSFYLFNQTEPFSKQYVPIDKSSSFFKLVPSKNVRFTVKTSDESTKKIKDFKQKQLLASQINSFEPETGNWFDIWVGPNNYNLGKDLSTGKNVTINKGDRLTYASDTKTKV